MNGRQFSQVQSWFHLIAAASALISDVYRTNALCDKLRSKLVQGTALLLRRRQEFDSIAMLVVASTLHSHKDDV